MNRFSTFLSSLILGVALYLVCAGNPAASLEVRGTARVVDGDTIYIDSLGIRLVGIDAPEQSQMCKDHSSKDYACGEAATRWLRKVTSDQLVVCVGQQFDLYKRLLAVCSVGTIDINRTMVREGLAWAFVKYSTAYASEEGSARKEKKGVFANANVAPWDYRSNSWTQSPSSGSVADGNCKIKGNVSRSGEQIYHMPWQRDYNRVQMGSNAGKRWFCSEEEAIKAGWRKAMR